MTIIVFCISRGQICQPGLKRKSAYILVLLGPLFLNFYVNAIIFCTESAYKHYDEIEGYHANRTTS